MQAQSITLFHQSFATKIITIILLLNEKRIEIKLRRMLQIFGLEKQLKHTIQNIRQCIESLAGD